MTEKNENDNEKKGTATLKAIEVVLPTVKLRIEDLAYLRGLAVQRAEGIKCRVPYKSEDRLRVLGLVQDVEIPPCPKEMKEYSDKRSHVIAELQRLMKDKPESWDLGAIDAVPLYNVRHAPKSRTELQITEAGMKLVAKGTAQVQIKAACK